MGSEQFGRGIENKSLGNSIDVDVQANTSNQFDDDVQNQDVSTTPVDTGEQAVSGASEISGDVEVNDGGDANLKVQWMNGDGDVITEQAPSELQGMTGTDGNDFNFIVKSTHFKIIIDGTSTDVDATINAHQ